MLGGGRGSTQGRSRYGRTKHKTLNFFVLLPFCHSPALEINTVSFLMQGFSTRSSFAPQETFDNI